VGLVLGDHVGIGEPPSLSPPGERAVRREEVLPRIGVAQKRLLEVLGVAVRGARDERACLRARGHREERGEDQRDEDPDAGMNQVHGTVLVGSSGDEWAVGMSECRP
jgi:hypothetical protein